MKRPRILLSGFEPYRGPTNATEVLVRSLRGRPPASWRAGPVEVVTRIFPVRTEKIAAALDLALQEVRPAACLFFGQAPGLRRIDVEAVAVNRLDFSRPDVDGVTRSGEPVVAAGPERLRTTLPDPAGLVAALWRVGVPAALSRDAGRYLCNQLFYLGVAKAGVPAGFIHVPLLSGQEPGQPGVSLGALRQAAEALVGQLEPSLALKSRSLRRWGPPPVAGPGLRLLRRPGGLPA